MMTRKTDTIIKFDPSQNKQRRGPKSATFKIGSIAKDRLPALAMVLFFGTMGLLAYWKVVDTPETQVNDRIAGIVRVIDGDTILIRRKKFRINGIDAPEANKSCSRTDVHEKASRTLESLVAGRKVTCDVQGVDHYGRPFGKCEVGGSDLAKRMVELGWARDWPKYSGGAYASAERDARRTRRGMWGLNCPNSIWGNRQHR